MKHKIQKEKNSKVEIEISLEKDEFMSLWDKAFKEIQKEIEIDGFRKGNAPKEAILVKYGEDAIFQEMANIAINDSYPKIIIEEKVKVISEPHIHIVKMSKEEGLVYHAHVSVYPEIKLPEYKKIAKEVMKDKKEIAETTEEEVNKVLNELDESVKSETPDLEKRIKDNMKLEKEFYEKSRIRSLILESFIKETEKDNSEIWPEGFTDKDKAQIIVMQIAKEEKIEASQEEINQEMMNVMMQLNPKDMEDGKIDEMRIRSYSEQIIINEKVLSMLEK